MLIRIAAAAIIGFLLRFVLCLEAIAWMAWLVPAILLWAVLKVEGRWHIFALAACLIGYQVNAPYYLRVMPGAAAIAVILGQSLVWIFVLSETRRAVRRSPGAWAMLAYPVLWVAVDTLMAAFLPDGNWGSLAYTQSTFLPLMQAASLFGVPGVLFLLCLIPSCVAIAAAGGWRHHSHRAMLAAAFLLAALAVLFGVVRLRQPQAGARLRIGMAAVDDSIGLKATPYYTSGIWSAYQQHIRALAAQGARIVLLPEKIAVATPAGASEWNSELAAAAATHRVWLVAGIAVSGEKGISNEAWIFSPDGGRQATYRKHFMAPPERAGYIPGRDYLLIGMEGTRAGIAICKDMHFATLGRANAARGAALMLVPAWDFVDDRSLAAAMTSTRGIENGYAIVRSSREGLLTVTDAYGRTLAQNESSSVPGRRLAATLVTAGRVPTLYTRIGDSLGWLCVAAAACLLWLSRRAA